MVGKNSIVWEHFNRVTEYMVSCKHCGKSLSSKHTSSNLVRHIYRQHKPIAQQFNIEDVKDPLEKFTKRQISDSDDSYIKDDNEFCETEMLEPMCETEMEQQIMGTRTQTQYEFQPGSPESKQYMEKLLAETRYFNEMALLARAKRLLIEARIKKLTDM